MNISSYFRAKKCGIFFLPFYLLRFFFSTQNGASLTPTHPPIRTRMVNGNFCVQISNKKWKHEFSFTNVNNNCKEKSTGNGWSSLRNGFTHKSYRSLTEIDYRSQYDVASKKDRSNARYRFKEDGSNENLNLPRY